VPFWGPYRQQAGLEAAADGVIHRR
jgi:hypothetical protein